MERLYGAYTAQGKDYELILTVKMETRHPVGGSFSREFSAFVIIAELSRKTRKNFEQFCFFLEKRPYGKFLKFCSESLHDDTD